MPLYEYECEVCGKIKELVQKFSDAPLKKCDSCSGKMRKLISNTSFHLKGTGWYVTDYARGKSVVKNSKKKENKNKGNVNVINNNCKKDKKEKK